MWLFSRKKKPPELPNPESPAPEVVRHESGPQLVRRVEITVEREWTSTITRRKAKSGPPNPEER
jgi:hypothetical protein